MKSCFIERRQFQKLAVFACCFCKVPMLLLVVRKIDGAAFWITTTTPQQRANNVFGVSSWKEVGHSLVATRSVVLRRQKQQQQRLIVRRNAAAEQPLSLGILQDETVASIQKGFPNSEKVDWIVYVDQSKASLEKGGVATLDAFMGLAPSDKVLVKAANFPTKPPPKGKGPFIRCVPMKPGGSTALEVSNVNSVEKVYRILTKHMGLSGITVQMCDCLKLKYKGTGYLEAKKATLAIDAYNRALELNVSSQQGVLLFMRAAAHAALAATHRYVLRGMLKELQIMVVPQTEPNLKFIYALAVQESGLTNAILRKIRHDTGRQEQQLGRIQFRHGLYQHAMLLALEDAQKATMLLPQYAPAWERAGSILSDLWRLEESLTCYEQAHQLDPSLEMSSALETIRTRQKIVADAKSSGWAEDPLRLALDARG